MKYIYTFTLIFSLSLILIQGIGLISTYNKTYVNPEIKKIFGYKLSDFEEDIIDAKKFIGNKKIFSTYSSALEVATNQYQPTRYDYIIHVLGDKAREEYLNIFRKGNFDFVSIQKDISTIDWEYWIQNANWFFYKELYANYKPVYANDYLKIMTKLNTPDINKFPTDTKVDITYKNDNNTNDNNTAIIKVSTDNKINGIGTFRLNYDIKKLKATPLCFRKDMILQQHYFDTFNYNGYDLYKKGSFYLPLIGENEIPINILNGHGYVVISLFPHRFAFKNIKLSPLEYYETPMKYVEIYKIKNNDTIIIKKDFNNLNMLNLKTADVIKIGNQTYKVTKLDFSGKYIYLKLDKKINDKNKNYFFEITSRKYLNNEYILD